MRSGPSPSPVFGQGRGDIARGIVNEMSPPARLVRRPRLPCLTNLHRPVRFRHRRPGRGGLPEAAMTGLGPGRVKTRRPDLTAESSSRFRRYERTLYLVVSIPRSELRKQFCALQALASFHTAWKAGTHNHRTSFGESWSSSSLQQLNPVVMGPCFRRDAIKITATC